MMKLKVYFILCLVLGGAIAFAQNSQPNIKSGYVGNFKPALTATIANGGTTSSIVNMAGFVLTGIYVPATFTSTTLTFKASFDGTNFWAIKTSTSGTALSYTVAPGQYNAVNPQDFYGVNYLEIVSGSAEGAARTLNLSARGF